MAVTLAAVGAGALVVGTVGMVAASEPAHRPAASVGAAADVGDPALDRRVPEGHRLVGHGRLGLAVPEEWATDATYCGTPVEDTVVDPQGGICMALIWPPPADVTSVELGSGGDAVGERRADAIPALQREPTECRVDDTAIPPVDPSTGKRRLVHCSATVTDGSGSAITVSSTIADPAVAEAEVDRLADAVFLLDDDEAVVPSRFEGDGMTFGDDDMTHYRERLEAAGLEVDVVEVRRLPATAGRFVAVEPAVSTVLPRGATVRLEVEAPPETFVDGIRLGGNHTGHLGGGNKALGDGQIRAGATISLAVGESFWVFAEPVVWSQQQVDGGAASTTASGRILSGTSLERVNEDRGVAQWAAIRPGTSTVVMTVVDDEGVEHDAGTVTVEVTD